jgi:Fur family ferric uptake transcriptional regulator
VINPPVPVEARLRAAGLRVTATRLAVLQALDELHDHVTVEQVRQHVTGRIGAVSLQAVYDILAALTAAGLVRCLETPGHPARYESRVGDKHHHFVCRRCGRTVDVAGAEGETPCLEPRTLPSGFLVLDAEVTYWGTCPDCQAKGGEEK